MSELTLEAVSQGGWHRYLVTFADATQALDFMTRKADAGIWLNETEDPRVRVVSPDRIGPYSEAELDLHRALYPECHHGLSADLCMDPVGQNHWGSYEQERMEAGF